MGPKRKRSERGQDTGRPSPHRPAETPMGQRDRDNFDSPGRGRGGRNPRRNDRRDSSQNYSGQHGSLRSQRPTSPTASRQAVPPQPPPSIAATNERQPPPSAAAPASPPPASSYPYDILTDDKIAAWKDTARQSLIEHGVQSRQDVDVIELSNLFQEFIHSVVERRLSPSDAGSCVKEIVGPESKEIIKEAFSYEPHKLFLDSLTTVLDDQPDVYTPALRDFLVATGISPSLMRQVLDAPLLQKLGLIRDTFVKLGIRHSTNLLYRQANYNLLREESEGYSKLLTELFTSFAEAPSTEVPSTEVAQATFERIKALIGTFDLDVGRVLDVALDVCATSLVKASKFFVKLLRVSSWWPRRHVPTDAFFAGGLPAWASPRLDDQDQGAIAELKYSRNVQFWDRAREKHIKAWFELGGKQVTDGGMELPEYLHNSTGEETEAAKIWMEATKTLPPQGNRVAAQLLGFKLRYYASDYRDGEILPANLLYLAALLIKIGFISIVDLYPHLWPKDEQMENFRDEKMKEVEAEERKKRGGGQPNALLMAGMLSEEDAPGARPGQLRDGNKLGAQANASTTDASERSQTTNKPLEQKGALVTSLLTVGAIPEALFLIGRWPWLPEAFPEILDRVNRLLEHSIQKVWEESRPRAAGPMECPPKKMPDPDQSGMPKGTVKLSPMPTRKAMRWPYPDGRQGTGDQPYRFFWDDWADNVPVCQNVTDVFTLCDTFMKVSGPNIGKSPKVMDKLLAIGEKSLAGDKSQENFNRWQELLRCLLVPALSMTSGSPNASEMLWSLLKLYPAPVRYGIYAEWFEGQTSRHPAMRTAFARTKAETQSVMKRVSNRNMTDSAKTLSKASHSSPGIVCRVALEQISSYANLTDAMVECCKYFTDLSKDVLVWSLLVALGSNQRSRTQASYILSVSAWLQALSGFTGKVFRRYKELDTTPILQYVNNQLFHSNSTDLIILEELTLSMGGIVKTLDITDEQVMAMSGMTLLQRHTLVSMRDNRFESTRSSKRLMQALIDSRLAGRLLINIAQFRQSSSFRLADDGAHVKFLSNMIDNSHQILLQYLDLLRFNLSPVEFDKLVPDIGQLMADFGLDASLAFMIGRESLASHMFSRASPVDAKQKLSSQTSTDKDGDISMNEDGAPGIANGTPSAESETPLADHKSDSPVVASGIFDALQPVIGSIQTTATSAIPQKLSAEFFVIFWALQLGDIMVPWDSYRIAQDRCELQWRQLVKDRSDMSKAGSEKREAQKAEVQAEMKALLVEGKQHSERVAKAKVHFTKRMSTWFPGPIERLGGVSDAIIEQCLFPRLVVSKADTEYAYALIKQLHELSCPNFRLKALYDRLFNANRIRLMLFTCTVREAELFGRFFHHVLRELAAWHKDSSIYLREAVGKSDKKPQTRLGFADKFGEDGQPTSHIEHAQFRDDLFGWHKSLNVALKSCLAGTEWAHIRNAISFLTAINQFFPAVDFMGTQLYTQLEKVGEREEHSREDLSTLANGALSVLARRKASWVKVQAFRTNISAQDQKDQQPKTAPGSSLRADAPTFQPKPNANDEEDGEVQDGGKDQTPAAAANPQRSASSQQDVPKATANAVTQRDSPKPATSTPPTAPAASTPKSAASVPGPTSSTSRDPKQAAPSPANQNKNTPRAPHNLPARPPGPIPESVPQGSRYGRDLRDVRDSRGSRERDTRDTRETRDPRDSRVDAARPDRGRELSTPEQRGPTRDVGGLAPEKEWPSPSTGRDHPLPARDTTTTNERVNASSARTPEPNRTSREVAAPTNASEPKVEEPRINPARAALIQGDTSERQDHSNRPDKSRLPDSDRRGGRSQQQQPGPNEAEATGMNPERAARFNEGRPMRDEPRERPASRNISPRRNPRADPVPDRPREEHSRNHYAEHRSHARDSRGDGNQGTHPRDDGHNMDSTRDAFLGSSRGPEVEHGRTRQDESYGRLNQSSSIDSQADGPPSGPKGRGGRTTSRTSNVNMPPRFSYAEGSNADMADDRRPPTGPSSGRGRHPYGPGPTPGPDNAGPPGPPTDRGRQTPSGPPPGQQSTSSPVPAGVHPDRLAQMGGAPPGQSPYQQQHSSSRGPSAMSHNTREQPPVNMSGSPASDPQVPTGPGGDRRRGGGGRRQLDGINSTLQQAQANMPETSRAGTTSSRGRSNRQSLMGSDAQVLTGGSPVTTPSHERPNPMPPPDRESAGGDLSKGDPERRDRDRSQRSGRSSRRHSRDADREREKDRERERSPAREREAKEPREYRERHSGGPGHGFGTRDEREREPRRSARDQPGVGPRNPHPSSAQGTNSEPMGSREPRRRDDRPDAAGGGRSEDRNGGGMRGYPRSGPREGGSRPAEDRRNAPRDDRGRKRRSEDVTGFPSEKRLRH